MAAKSDIKKQNITSTVAKSDDGTVQITFTVAYPIIENAKQSTAEELGKDLEIPGFRKGKAPINKVIEHIPENTLLEKSLSKILPKYVGDAIEEHKLKPVIYPRFELLKANPGEDWQIRATTAEIPEFDLPDYKQSLAMLARGKKEIIWTPKKAKEDDKKELSREEKENEVLKTLIEKTNLTIPKILIDDEANSHLSKLLERLEKLGLTLESYLASIGKTAETLRSEYETQARNSIVLDLVLTKIADTQKVTVDEKEVDSAIKASLSDPNSAGDAQSPDRKKLIESILRRRKVVDSLVALI